MSDDSSGEKGEDERGHDDLWRGRDEKRGSDAASASDEEPSAGGVSPTPDATHSPQPFSAGRASHVPISSLNPPADLLAVASAAISVAMDVEIGRNEAPFEFRLTLATCTCSKVAAAVAETAWLRVACECQAWARARPCAHGSPACARRAARHHWLSARPRSRAQASRKRERLCGRSVAIGDRLECWSCRRSRGRPWLGWAMPMWVTALSRGAWTAFRGS